MILANAQANLIIPVIYLAIIGLLSYFLLVKPAKARNKQYEEMVKQLKVGDEIITKSGVKGKIVKLDDVYFVLETVNNTQIEYLLQALSYVITPINQEEVIEKKEEEVTFDTFEEDAKEDNEDEEVNF